MKSAFSGCIFDLENNGRPLPFPPPNEGEEPQLLSAAEIFDHLYGIDARTMRGINRQNFGAELRSFGVVRTKMGNRRVYEVKAI